MSKVQIQFECGVQEAHILASAYALLDEDDSIDPTSAIGDMALLWDRLAEFMYERNWHDFNASIQCDISRLLPDYKDILRFT